MTKDNLSVVLMKKDELRLEQRPIKKPENNELLIAVQSVGICGSDIHFYKEGGIEGFPLTEPTILGHETSGIIAEVGEGVKNFKPGDRVSIDPVMFCKTCEFCKRGCFNWCSNPRCCGLSPTQGSLSQYFVHPADFCWKLPDNISLDEGAVIEPLACAVHGCKRAEISAGDKVLICGVGTIGLLSMLTAKQMGASKICVTDISSSRLEAAKHLGADHVALVESQDAHVIITKIHQALGGPPDITLECSGTASGISMSIPATRSGGVVVLVGLGPHNVTLPIIDVIVREVDVRGSIRYGKCYSIALDLIASGKVNVKPLITHHFKLEDSVKAFETSRNGDGGAIKVLIHCNQEASI